MSLDERRRLEDFVQCSEAAGQGDEGVGVLHEHQFADEEVPEGHPAIEEGVGFLFLRQLDVAADGVTADFFCTAVGGLHNARSPASHHREAGLCQPPTDFAGLDVVLMFGRESRRTEYRHTRTHEMEIAEAPNDLEENLDGPDEFETAPLWPLKELRDLRNGWSLAPVRR